MRSVLTNWRNTPEKSTVVLKKDMHRAVYLGKKRVTKDGQNINSEKKKRQCYDALYFMFGSFKCYAVKKPRSNGAQQC